MILFLKPEASQKDVDELIERLSWMGLTCHPSGEKGAYTIAVVQGADSSVDLSEFEMLPMVAKVTEFKAAYKLASREFHPNPSTLDIKGVKIGGGHFQVMAGPCSVESAEQIDDCAKVLADEGVKILRGGAFKPRTSPYSFQGLGEKGLQILKEAAEKYNLITISEVMDGDQIDLMADYIDILQVGARNMQNFTLLKKLGECPCPVFLKRGLSATYKDLLMSAEYILDRGNPNVILCERGIRTFETYSRNTLDLNAVPILHQLSHLPVVVDPSHGTGIRSLVAPMARAGMAAGADGLMLEIHKTPEKAASDKDQTIDFPTFRSIMKSLRIIEKALS